MKRARVASAMVVTGFTAAKAWSQPGIESTGTNTDEANVRGRMRMNP